MNTLQKSIDAPLVATNLPSDENTWLLRRTRNVHREPHSRCNLCGVSLSIITIASVVIGSYFTRNQLGMHFIHSFSTSQLQDSVAAPIVPPVEVPVVSVQLDPTLNLTVSTCVDLLYSHGADESLDRPSYLRAASSMQWINENRLAVVQDDSNFIAILDIKLGDLHTESPVLHIQDAFSIALPAVNGSRQFSKDRGNKNMKLDLEASVYVPRKWSPLNEGFFLGFGSGSSKYRNVVIFVRDSLLLSNNADVSIDFQPVNTSYWKDYCGHEVSKVTSSPLMAFYAPELYQTMRDQTDFSGSELNIEGAAFIPSTSLELSSKIRFFQRGNGAADSKRGLTPKSSTAEVLAPDVSLYHDWLSFLTLRSNRQSFFATWTRCW